MDTGHESEESLAKNKLDLKKYVKARNKNKPKQRGRKAKENNNKLFLKVFLNLKGTSKNIREFAQLLKVEKQLKNNFFTSYTEFVQEIRKIFSAYFCSFSNNPEKYSKIFEISDSFENLIKEYENKIFVKESKNLIELKKKVNKLKRNAKLAVNENQSSFISNTKFKISFDDSNPISPKRKNKNSLKQYKIFISQQLKALSTEQKKNIIKIISNNYLNKNLDNIYEIDINKMNFNQLKAIENFINRGLSHVSPDIGFLQSGNSFVSPQNCETESVNNNFSHLNHFNNSDNQLLKKESEILDDDDISESLSDDDDDSSNMSNESFN